jgi:hypothetical protein
MLLLMMRTNSSGDIGSAGMGLGMRVRVRVRVRRGGDWRDAAGEFTFGLGLPTGVRRCRWTRAEGSMVITRKVVDVMGALAAHGDRHAGEGCPCGVTCGRSRRAESESESLVFVERADWCWRGRGRYRGGELLMIRDWCWTIQVLSSCGIAATRLRDDRHPNGRCPNIQS